MDIIPLETFVKNNWPDENTIEAARISVKAVGSDPKKAILALAFSQGWKTVSGWDSAFEYPGGWRWQFEADGQTYAAEGMNVPGGTVLIWFSRKNSVPCQLA